MSEFKKNVYNLGLDILNNVEPDRFTKFEQYIALKYCSNHYTSTGMLNIAKIFDQAIIEKGLQDIKSLLTILDIYKNLMMQGRIIFQNKKDKV